MADFTIQAHVIDGATQRHALATPSAGAYVAFEGWVRDHHEGKAVMALEYEAYAPLASSEGRRILDEAHARFSIEEAAAVHRVGFLRIGEVAVWVGVVAAHRREAFEACQYIIDTLKARVPIWKKEYFRDGSAAWVACHHCGGSQESQRHAHP